MLGMLCLAMGAPLWALEDKSDGREGSAIVLDEAVVSAKRDTEQTGEIGYAPLASEQLKITPADRARTSSTADLLDNVPGVSLQQTGGLNVIPYLNGLGDDRIRIKLDGMDLISACANHMNSPLSYISPTNVNKVNVLAGITPVSVGGDSIAGTILVDSPALEFAKPGEGLLKGEAGSYYRSNGNAFGGNLSTTVANDYLSFRYSGAEAQSDNYHAARDFKPAGRAAVDRGWLAGDEVGSSSYQAWYHAISVGLQKDIHSLQVNFGIQDIPYQGFPNQRMDMTDNYSEQINLHYTGQYWWGALEARFYNERTRHSMDFGDDKRFFYDSKASKGTVLAPGMPMETCGINTGALVKGKIPLSDHDTLTVGVEGQVYRLDDWWPPSPSALPPGIKWAGMAPDTFLNINDGRRDRVGAFAEWEARWNPQWMSLLGGRIDTVMMDTGDVHGYNEMMYNGAPLFPATTFNNSDRQRTDVNFDVTALTRYTPSDMFTIEAGYARKTRSPNLYERYAWSTSRMAMEMINFAGDGNYYIGNRDLEPEVANIFSVTADLHDACQDRWGLKVTPYYNWVEDYIDVRRCPKSVCGDTPAIVANLKADTGFVFLQFLNQPAEIYGVDVSGYFRLIRSSDYGSLTATGILSYSHGENMTTGDNLYNIMPLNGKVALVHRFGKLTNTIEGQLVDAKTQLSQVRDEVRTDSYGLLNLRSSYEWKNLRLDAGIENVLNQFYSLPLGGLYVGQGATMRGDGIPWGIPLPGPGRSFYAGVTAKF